MTLSNWLTAALVAALVACAVLHSADGALAALVAFAAIHLMRTM